MSLVKLSNYLAPTLRENPKDAEVLSHILSLRGGYVRPLASGIYNFYPLGWRIMKKIMNIIREEMDRIGGHEILMPAMTPRELWEETGRWDLYGDLMVKLKDRQGREFALGPTHEEIITDIVRKEVNSYKQLPLILYQIQTKFRDELRPRGGILRSREFIMKDAYSFHADEESLENVYQDFYNAYCRIFERCGLEYRAVEADSGPIGGSASHEFMVLADSGEDFVLVCDSCQYAANQEKAEVKEVKEVELPQVPLEEIHTPSVKTVEEVCKYLNISPQNLIKTLIYETSTGEVVAVLVRGDREINEVKVKNYLGVDEIHLASASKIEEITGAKVGFAGPVGLNIRILADNSIKTIEGIAVSGANKTDYHLKGINWKRDFKAEFGDFRNCVAGDRCPKCEKGKMGQENGIEVGHIFKLGTKYSKLMKAEFSDKDGKRKHYIMGCYGIGVGRIMAAAMEQLSQEKKVILPKSIAPFEVEIIMVNSKDKKQQDLAEKLGENLSKSRIDVLVDDRNMSVGAKFKDADFFAAPLRIVLGPKNLAEGKVELQKVKEDEKVLVDLEKVIGEVKEYLFEEE